MSDVRLVPKFGLRGIAFTLVAVGKNEKADLSSGGTFRSKIS